MGLHDRAMLNTSMFTSGSGDKRKLYAVEPRYVRRRFICPNAISFPESPLPLSSGTSAGGETVAPVK